MSKIIPSKPFLMIFYGFPGSGKTYFARQFCENVQAAHLESDRIRMELFEKPRYDQQENMITSQIMTYMTEEFLSAGLSVIFDVNALRAGQRKMLHALANKYKVPVVTVWLQLDPESSYDRSIRRDRRKADDKYAAVWDRKSFDQIIASMQKPDAKENPVVISGKHLYTTQRNAVFKTLRDNGIIVEQDANRNIAKPGMVNLVSSSFNRVDYTKRNISIN